MSQRPKLKKAPNTDILRSTPKLSLRRPFASLVRRSKRSTIMSFTPPYKYITASELAEKVKQADPQQVQVIDVRDDDFVGGNIVGAKNSPSNAFYDNVKELVEENKDSKFKV